MDNQSPQWNFVDICGAIHIQIHMNTLPGWTPLWSTIVLSTLWSEKKEVRILFVTMLAMKDAEGVVHGTLAGLTRLANLSEEETREAVQILESPDTRSDTHQEFDGRRIERVEGGWRVLNHHKYRDMVQAIKKREYNRKWMAKSRGTPLAGESIAVKAMKRGDNKGADAIARERR